MHMDGTILYGFEDIMRQARWYESKGDSAAAQKYYDEAKRWYIDAENEYGKAYRYAERYDDYSRKQEAYSSQREACRKKEKASCAGYSL